MSLAKFPLLRLPNELILVISSNFDVNDLNSLLKTNRRLASVLAFRLSFLRGQLLQSIAKEDGKTGLCCAVEHNNEALVRLVLEELVDVDVNETIDIHGRTALHWAAENCHVKLVKLLLEKGANFAARTINGLTPLHKAVSDEQILRMLLEKGADITARSAEGSTPLNAAVYVGDEQIVKILLESGSDVQAATVLGETPLHRAAWRGHEAVTILLLRYGADIKSRNRRGATPLHQAARGIGPCEPLVMILLQEGADVLAMTEEGETPLHHAVERMDEAVVRLLLGAGADVSAKDYYGSTALHWAAYQGGIQIVQLLFRYGADIDARKKGGVTALHIATCALNAAYSEAIVNMCLEEGADITAVDDYGKGSLHHASGHGNKQTVKLLLKKGADVNARTRVDGNTSLHAAARRGHTDIVTLLLDHGAEIDAVDKRGKTPLHFAVQGAHKTTARAVLERSVCKSVDSHGAMALDETGKLKGYQSLVQILLDRVTSLDSLAR